MFTLQVAALDRSEETKRPDRMFVDRIMMVHVKLHLRDDAAEVRNETAEYSGLVHPAQNHLGLIDRGKDLHEQRVCTGILTHRSLNQHGIATCRAHCCRMDLQPLSHGDGKHFDQSHWVELEKRIVGDGDASPIENEPTQAFRPPPADCWERKAEPFLAKLLVQLSKE